MRSNVGLLDFREVFLTHYHADHYLGLPGMLKTFALRGRDLPITIYGPRGPHRSLLRATAHLREAHVPVRARRAGRRVTLLDRGEYRIVTFKVMHGVPALGYALVEEDRARAASTSRPPTGSACRRGRSAGGCRRARAIALDDGKRRDSRTGARRGRGRGGRWPVTGDTAPSLGYIELADGAELLVHEATFCEDERERAHRRRRTRPRARRRRWRAAAGVEDARAHAPLVAVLLARRSCARHVARFRRRSCPATST